jgi:hypothetical protein
MRTVTFAVFSLFILVGSADAGILQSKLICGKPQPINYSSWKVAQAACAKVAGTASAPVCGGTCTGGNLCDISIDSNGKSSCACS